MIYNWKLIDQTEEHCPSLYYSYLDTNIMNGSNYVIVFWGSRYWKDPIEKGKLRTDRFSVGEDYDS